MYYLKSFMLSLIAGGLTLSASPAVLADTTETTQTTTTVTTGSTPFDLPSTDTYVVVDPITGVLKGSYDPVARLVKGTSLQTGLVIVNENNGGLVATVDASGHIVDVSSAPATETLVVSLDSRRQELNRRIQDALVQGQLNSNQASAMRAELERIASEQAAARQTSGVLTYARALQLGYGLNALSDRLVPIVHADTFQRVIAPEFIVVNGQLQMVGNVIYRRQQLATRIDDEYAAGRLSAQQVSQLKSDLDKITTLDARYRKHGELSDAKERKVSEKLDAFQASLNNDVSRINQKRSRLGLRVD